MAIAQAVTCNICGKQKGSVNHWWLFGITHVLGDEEYLGFEAKPWIQADAEYMRHACGQECLIKALSQWMQLKQEIEATA